MLVLGLILFVGGPTIAAILLTANRRTPTPVAPLRSLEGGLGRVYPAWWDELDGWRNELGDGAA